MLTGLSVLDLSIWRPGPYATSLLRHLGADVLKVEPPGGDPMRHYAGLFESVNAGKRSIVLDLKQPSDRSRALELAAACDVVVEGFRPGVVARLGIDEPTVRELNPRVVYCSISGYGQRGPRAELPGHDVNYQAWAGALAPEGSTAAMPPLPVADLASGMAAAFGICAALVGRGVHGRGTYLDVSMTDVMATWTGSTGAASSPGDTTGDSSVPGYGLFSTAGGGQVALGVVNEQHFWSALCATLGLSSLTGVPFEERTARSTELGGTVARAVATWKRDELVDALAAQGVPVAPVLDRAGMLASGPFPAFPIGLPGGAGTTAPPAPSLDQHRGEGFGCTG
jgi:crotonobetainyl-CoA:carnitine CoA-transferase CaiB-like acyl-CoA transferase